MAEILQTATEPVDRVEVDPVTLDIIENALRNARYEMDEVLFRTALSPGIREQHDEFPLIADPSGKMVVGQFGLSIPDFLDGFEGDIGPGDVLPGPAIVTEMDSTTLVLPGHVATVDRCGSLLIRPAAGRTEKES